MDFAISTACFYPMLTEEAIRLLCDNGIRKIEIFFNSPMEFSNPFLKKQKKVLDSFGTSVIAAHPFSSVYEPFFAFSTYKRRFFDLLEEYKRYFESLGILGAEFFVFHGDRLGSLLPIEEAAERIYQLTIKAREFGLTLVQENVSRCMSAKTEYILALRELLRDDISFLFDTKQALRAGQSHEDMLAAMGERLAYVHLSDYDEEKGDCLLPFDGSLNIPFLLQKIKQAGYNQTVTLEVYSNCYEESSQIFAAFEALKERCGGN